ncbi:phosphatidate cytidylyltransferase [Pacificimonas sp. WHA3]|uniref:Phosphatidate cytidylyltransferase n=1 Tax=Pacificimonas pallii TaxID=2827236 RepID=A0ABS6SFE4_9SPHN|nr:phosphatidate cytidylyltransferase [Pacificimonas pallii]MBV7256577.1 phosphatidate cytidylyltransferase [Pacificimonas pallii]
MAVSETPPEPAGAEPVRSERTRETLRVRYKDLMPRFIVGVLLIAIAIFGGWQGGLFFNFLMGIAALLVFREWTRMVGTTAGNDRMVGFIGIGAAVVLGNDGLVMYGFAALAVAAIWYLFTDRRAAMGILYAGLPFMCLIWLRYQENGFGLIVWTLAVVWATDIGAYFSGRTIGGPKIAPAISPSKTWAGLAGGMFAAAGVGVLNDFIFQLPFEAVHAAALGALLAVIAQVGDFYESHLKRRAGVKDSGHLLPGHGGVMDRLDGLVPVSILVASAVWFIGQ